MSGIQPLLTTPLQAVPEPPHHAPAATFAPSHNLVSTCSLRDSAKASVRSCLASAQKLPIAPQHLPSALGPTGPVLHCLAELSTQPSLSPTLLQPHQLPHCSPNTPATVLPRGLCTAVFSAWNLLLQKSLPSSQFSVASP